MVQEQDVLAVFEAWRKRQVKPDLVTLTSDRRQMIAMRLQRGHTAKDLQLLIRYAYEADTSEARFWRGENEGARKYLGLDNLLRSGKLADRIQNAREWDGELYTPGVQPRARVSTMCEPEDGVRYTVVGMLRRGGR